MVLSETTTLGSITHTPIKDRAAAIAFLPALSALESNVKTGTDDVAEMQVDLQALQQAPQQGTGRQELARMKSLCRSLKQKLKTPKSLVKQSLPTWLIVVGDTGLEPVTPCL